jgi:hypothetical protein
VSLLVGLVTAVVIVTASASAARETIPHKWKNCTIVNQRYPHGVGKRSAHDSTKSGAPVTNFRRSTALYLAAVHYNKRLDADKDGIACEKQ